MLPRTDHDFYAVLGIRPDASLDEIKAAFYAKARATHPDKTDAPAHSPEFQIAQAAWETLRNAASRAKYDAALVESRGPDRFAQTVAPDDVELGRDGKAFLRCRCGDVIWLPACSSIGTAATDAAISLECASCSLRYACAVSLLSTHSREGDG